MFTYRQSASDFATVLLCGSNAVERCALAVRVLKGQGLPATGYNNKAAQIDQIHRAMHHRSHQTEY
jgi:ActR/RegA family two-component response regulator